MAISSFAKKISDNISGHQLFEEESALVVCVSGGSDSVALLHILLELRKKWKHQLHIVHFDHGLRPESLAERHFVEALAQQYNLPCYTLISQAPAREFTGVQEKSRHWRMQLSEKIRAEINAACIATAHHADDQTETFLFKMLRGCHLSNLRGMEWKNGFHIRPLLNCTKLELQQYLRSISQTWMEDRSNQSSRYLRNRIRLELIPLMNVLARGEIVSRIDDLSEQSAQLKQWIRQSGCDTPWKQGRQQDMLLIKNLQEKSTIMQSTYLYQFLSAQGVCNLNYIHIRQILDLLLSGKNQWELHLPGKKICKREGEIISVCSEKVSNFSTWRFDTIEIGNHLDSGQQVHCQFLKSGQAFPSKGLVIFNVAPQSHLIVRYREAGDRFHPHWRTNPLKLKDFLRDQNFPLHQRNRLPLICHQNQILAIYPYFRSKSFYQDEQKFPPLHFHLTLQSD